MSLRPLKTVNRRGDWRARLPLWDRETFQSYRVGEAGEADGAIVSCALYHREGSFDHRHWLRDYGWWCHRHHHRPLLNVFNDDGTGFLRIADDRVSALLSIPQPILAAIHPGVYRLSLAVAYGDGSVIDLGTDLVTIEGHTTPTEWHGLLMAGGQQGAGTRDAVNDYLTQSLPILPGVAGQQVIAEIVGNRTDLTPDATPVVPPPPFLVTGPMAAGGYQPAGWDVPVNTIVTGASSGS